MDMGMLKATSSFKLHFLSPVQENHKEKKGLQVHTVAKTLVLIFQVLMPCGPHQENRDSKFLQNAGIYLQDHTALQSRRPTIVQWKRSVKLHTFRDI
jgi:hypothetical protein